MGCPTLSRFAPPLDPLVQSRQDVSAVVVLPLLNPHEDEGHVSCYFDSTRDYDSVGSSGCTRNL